MNIIHVELMTGNLLPPPPPKKKVLFLRHCTSKAVHAKVAL